MTDSEAIKRLCETQEPIRNMRKIYDSMLPHELVSMLEAAERLENSGELNDRRVAAMAAIGIFIVTRIGMPPTKPAHEGRED